MDANLRINVWKNETLDLLSLSGKDLEYIITEIIPKFPETYLPGNSYPPTFQKLFFIWLIKNQKVRYIHVENDRMWVD